ncbi:competence protein ComEA [Actinomadura luteofluorescens]|uniref:Competence protein ComEA n=1 Tax=Actinomadura luteofluorescens TaxID=46163 RepID=A0A7Y9EDU3_9ACTN|nr:ComEA family DNA-binding protein [Actinomadura luteofluorescens]NYD45797.1 competence protein ComEA [Actinomadura luteofluorescens]
MRPDTEDRLHTLTGRWKPAAAPDDAPPAARLRATPDRSHVRMLILVGVLAALVAAGYLWLARPRPQPAAPAATASLSEPRPTLSASPAAAASSPVLVHVLGKVRHPGVVTLPPGSRVAEAIKAAGGVLPGANTGTLNLARPLVDGEQIPVGVRAPSPPPPPPGAATTTVPGAPGAPLDLNAATPDQLDDLPGVGPVLAQRIVAYRTQHGGFRSVEQLQDVSGIGAHRFADLKTMVRV